MTAVALVRAPFQPLAAPESWDDSLLAEALKLLNYKPTLVAEREQARTRSANEIIFARVLKELDIQPFTIQSVRAYQTSMLQKALKGQSWRLTQFMHRQSSSSIDGPDTVRLLGWPAWLSCIATAGLSAVLHFGGYEAGWGWDEKAHKSIEIVRFMPLQTASHIVALPALALATWAFLMYLRHKRAIAITASWKAEAIGQDEYGQNHAGAGYRDIIPSFAIQRMLTLKAALPEVTFHVEQLNSTKTELNTKKVFRRPPDPFLIATFRGISAYIDVWDEPRFEGRRQI